MRKSPMYSLFIIQVSEFHIEILELKQKCEYHST